MARWDARETFSIDPNATTSFTCVGITKSENRRCHNAIGKLKCNTAAKLLDELSALPISGQGYNERRLKGIIKELLDEVLCWRHKDGGGHSQIEKVEKEWWCKVQMAQAATRNNGRQQPAQMVQRRREYRPVADVEPAVAEWASQCLELNPIEFADQIRVLEERLARDEAERAELTMRVEERRRIYERIREEQRRAREREKREAAMRRREEEERRRDVERIQRERQREANRIRDEREEMMRMDREFALRLVREEEEEEELRREEEAEAEAQQQRAALRALRRVENGRQAQVPYLFAVPQLFRPRPVQREVQLEQFGNSRTHKKLAMRYWEI
ncbi:putative znf1p protein [Botrytis fragariae]|uniref:Putative znf1p protein n=1 Tax=Botrytis fragariae TaxID=1964551 RepID=A0A8H6AVH0_9HELO|nr:putative znf1p protein [Botrytis fragariae]KAF5874372.1 putative znf1p protein [Botrytis fragariae]